MARCNLARWTGEAGDAAGALDQFAALLPIVAIAKIPGGPDYVQPVLRMALAGLSRPVAR